MDFQILDIMVISLIVFTNFRIRFGSFRIRFGWDCNRHMKSSKNIFFVTGKFNSFFEGYRRFIKELLKKNFTKPNILFFLVGLCLGIFFKKFGGLTNVSFCF